MVDGATLSAMMASGEVRPTDEVATGDGWISLDQHPVLRTALPPTPRVRAAPTSDPWAAWSDVDSVDATSLYHQMIATPEPEPVQVEPEVEVDVPLGAPSLPYLPEPDSDAHVVDFTRARAGAGEPIRAIPHAPGEAPARARPVGTPPKSRIPRGAAMVLVGASLLALAYVSFPASTESAPAIPDAPVRRAAPAVGGLSPLVALDAELRADLSAHPRSVKEKEAFSDALLIELLQQRLDVVVASGLVTRWIGRKGDEPARAEVRIEYRTGGDPSRELGAIALVVGRYKRFYRMEMPVFEVTEADTRTVTTIDAEKAEDYYQARLSLEGLLSSIHGL